MLSDERRERAGAYVRGQLSDSERARAERDLEIDAEFRDAVVEVAESLHLFDGASAKAAPRNSAGMGWSEIADTLSGLPHMRPAPESPPVVGEPARPVTFGRRKTDRPAIAPVSRGAARRFLPARSSRFWTAAVILCGLVAAFSLGYLTGIGAFQPAAISALIQR